MDNQDSVGERIARYRKRRGLTQEVLAGQVGRSASWLTKVERGERVMDSISTLFELARVLKVEPGDLIGGISLPPNGGAPHEPPSGIPAIRHALFTVRLPDGPPPSADQVRAGVEQVRRLDANASFEALRLSLPPLVIASRAAVAQEVLAGWWGLAGACQAASSLARSVGETELALLTAERAVTASEQSGDALMTALSRQRLTSAMMLQGWLDDAGSLCSNASDAVAPTRDLPPEAWSAWGLLCLVLALVTVRAGNVAGAWRSLRDAWGAADIVGPERNDYWESFSPASVGAVSVGVALESGDVVEALRLADGVEVDSLATPERRAHFGLTVARAHALRRDDAAAVLLLLEAERHAAEVVRHSVQAREIVRVCLGRERKSRTPGLRALAGRLGVAD